VNDWRNCCFWSTCNGRSPFVSVEQHRQTKPARYSTNHSSDPSLAPSFLRKWRHWHICNNPMTPSWRRRRSFQSLAGRRKECWPILMWTFGWSCVHLRAVKGSYQLGQPNRECCFDPYLEMNGKGKNWYLYEIICYLMIWIYFC